MGKYKIKLTHAQPNLAKENTTKENWYQKELAGLESFLWTQRDLLKVAYIKIENVKKAGKTFQMVNGIVIVVCSKCGFLS